MLKMYMSDDERKLLADAFTRVRSRQAFRAGSSQWNINNGWSLVLYSAVKAAGYS